MNWFDCATSWDDMFTYDVIVTSALLALHFQGTLAFNLPIDVHNRTLLISLHIQDSNWILYLVQVTQMPLVGHTQAAF